MNRRRARILKARLYRPVPVIGAWLQRLAAIELGRDASPNAIKVLLKALDEHPDPRVGEIARRAIAGLRSQASIDVVCQYWSATRHPWLAEQIAAHGWVAASPVQARLLSALQAGRVEGLLDSDARLIPPLVKACKDRDETLAQHARQCLTGLRDPAAIDALCALWARSRAAFLEAAVLQAGYVAQSPLEVRVLSALKVGRAALIQDEQDNLVAALIQAGRDGDEQIAEQARQVLSGLSSEAAQQMLCSLVVEQGDSVAQAAALQGGFLPKDSYQRSLFLFLTGQWPAYLELDFDHRILGAAYQTAEAGLRRRILEQARASGQTRLLGIIAGRAVTFQTSEEAEFLARLLAETGEWGRLWEKVCEFPLGVSLQAVRNLAGCDWLPEREDERLALADLVRLASADMLVDAQAITKALPCAVLRARANLLAGRINSLAFAPQQPLAAVGTSTRKVVIWDFQRAQRQALLGSFDHSIGEVTYTHSGELAFAERTTAQELCATYLYTNGKPERVRQQKASITALEPVGASGLLVAGRDQSVALLEAGRQVAQTNLAFWPRAARVPPDGSRVALLHYGVLVLSLPGFEPLHNGRGQFEYVWSPGVLRCAAFGPDQLEKERPQAMIFGRASGQVLAAWTASHPDPRTGQPLRQLARHAQRVQGLEFLRDRSLVISVDAGGEVFFTGWANGKMLGKIHSPGAQTNSLHVSPDGSFMALGDSDASLSLWDLRVLDVPRLFSLPLAQSTPNQLAALGVLLASDGLPQPARHALAFLERLLRHRFRFDVEVSEVPTIQVGEYDIEID
ncbi:MAG: hypothetical protein AB1894_22490 [Chloroflexota bacterium]